jgi:hypothetical protein
MKKLKLFSIVAVMAMFMACGNSEPTIVRFQSEATKTVNVNEEFNFVVTVAVPQGEKGSTSITQTGFMPAGVTFVDNKDKTGKLSGTPTVTGTFNITFKASNNGVSTEQQFTLIVKESGSTGTGTKENPYDVAKIIELSPQSTTEAVEENIWVRGFIVGYYDNAANPSVVDMEAPFAKDENIMLAASATETNPANMICIQLPAGDIRNALGLMTTPANLKKEVKVHGDVMKYNTFPGIKNTDGYWWIVEDTGINPPEQGSFDVPVITISALRAMYSGSNVTLTGTNKIVGIITSDLVGGNSTSKKNLVITAEDNLTGIALRFTDADNTYAMGQKVEILLTGTLSTYDNALQFQVAKVNTRSIGTANITPRSTTVANLAENIATFECCVVSTSGVITGGSGATTYGNATAHQTNTLTDGSNTIDLFVARYATFINDPIPSGTKQVTGIAQSYNNTPQIIIRNLNDVQ